MQQEIMIEIKLASQRSRDSDEIVIDQASLSEIKR